MTAQSTTNVTLPEELSHIAHFALFSILAVFDSIVPALSDGEKPLLVGVIERRTQTSTFCTHLGDCFEKYRRTQVGFINENGDFVHVNDVFSNFYVPIMKKISSDHEYH